MALNFPSSPVPNQVYTAEGMTFVWNGSVWLLASADAIPFATEAEAIAGDSATTVMSPATTAAVVEALPGRNLIINGRGIINQRAYVSGTATTAAKQYTLDRWRVLVAGQSLVYVDEVYRRLMTAPAGGIEQVIESIHIAGGNNYTINWEGTATCTVNNVARVKGEVWGISPGVDVPIRFFNGTVTDVQFERANRPTPFESRLASEESRLCERYFERCVGAAYGYSNAVSTFVGAGVAFRAPKRTTPTVTWSSSQNAANVNQPYAEHITAYGFRAMAQTTATGNTGFAATYLADAEITA